MNVYEKEVQNFTHQNCQETENTIPSADISSDRWLRWCWISLPVFLWSIGEPPLTGWQIKLIPTWTNLCVSIFGDNKHNQIFKALCVLSQWRLMVCDMSFVSGDDEWSRAGSANDGLCSRMITLGWSSGFEWGSGYIFHCCTNSWGVSQGLGQVQSIRVSIYQKWMCLLVSVIKRIDTNVTLSNKSCPYHTSFISALVLMLCLHYKTVTGGYVRTCLKWNILQYWWCKYHNDCRIIFKSIQRFHISSRAAVDLFSIQESRKTHKYTFIIM